MNNETLLQTTRENIKRLWDLEEKVPEFKKISQGMNSFDVLQLIEDGNADYRDVEMFMSYSYWRFEDLGANMDNYSDLLDFLLHEQKEDGGYVTEKHWTAKVYIFHHALLEICRNNPRYNLYLTTREMLYSTETQAKENTLSREDMALVDRLMSWNLLQLECLVA